MTPRVAQRPDPIGLLDGLADLFREIAAAEDEGTLHAIVEEAAPLFGAARTLLHLVHRGASGDEAPALEVPITSRDATLGALLLFGDALDVTAPPAARAVAAQAGLAIENMLPARSSRSTETLYRTLVEQIPGVIYYRALDAPGEANFVSPQVEALLGYRPSQILSDPSFWR